MGGKKKGPTDEEKAASAAKKAAEQKARAEVAIFKAARDDDVKRVEAAVAKGASVDAVTGDYDHTVMHRAAAYNALRVIKYLHSQGAKLDTPDASKEKLTPLQTAKKIALSADAAALIEALVEGRNVDGMFGGDADDGDGDDSDGGEGAAAAKPKAEAASSSAAPPAEGAAAAAESGAPAAAAAASDGVAALADGVAAASMVAAA